jgi:hypothetical protein
LGLSRTAIQRPVTKKLRESDVLAIWFPDTPASPTVHAITVVFECKGSREPWVFFQGHSELEQGIGLPTRYTTPNCDICAKLLFAALDDVFGESNPKAYAVVQKRNTEKGRQKSNQDKEGQKPDPDKEGQKPAPDKDGPDHAWGAVQQVASAAVGLSTWSENQGHHERHAAELIIPVVVTKSPLVMCALGSDGEVSLRLSDKAQIGVALQGLPDDHEPVRVCVINRSALDDLLNRVTGVSANYEWED